MHYFKRRWADDAYGSIMVYNNFCGRHANPGAMAMPWNRVLAPAQAMRREVEGISGSS